MSRPSSMRYAMLVVVLATVGCARAADPVKAADDADPLHGRTFSSTVITEQGTPHALVAGTTLELRFTDDGRLVASAGCNTMSGTVALAGGRLDVADLSITEMACDPPRHEQDQRVSTFLAGKPSWRVDGENLTLSSTDTEIVLTRVNAMPLVGTTWTADTLIRGEVAGVTPAGVAATLVFGQDEATVSGLCNLRTVKYTASSTTIAFELGGLTLKMCAPEIMAVEDALVALAGGETTYRIDTNTLTITKGDKGLRFTAVP